MQGWLLRAAPLEDSHRSEGHKEVRKGLPMSFSCSDSSQVHKAAAERSADCAMCSAGSSVKPVLLHRAQKHPPYRTRLASFRNGRTPFQARWSGSDDHDVLAAMITMPANFSQLQLEHGGQLLLTHCPLRVQFIQGCPLKLCLACIFHTKGCFAIPSLLLLSARPVVDTCLSLASLLQPARPALIVFLLLRNHFEI